MGLFSSKRLYTSTQVMHMVEDTPDILQQSVLNSILESREVVPDILDTINNCLVTKADNYHKYAAKHYTNKLPEGSIGMESIDTSIVAEAISEDVVPPSDKEVLIIAAVIDDFNPDKTAFDWLNRNRPSWDETKLTWTEDVSPTVTTTVTFDSAKIKNADTVTITYLYKGRDPETGTITKYGEIDISVPFYPADLPENYYQAEYIIVDKTDPTKVTQSFYWQYPPSNGKHPELKLNEQKYSLFMPIVPIRIENQDYASEDRQDTELYKTSVKLLDKIDLDFKQLADGVNGNPDIKNVDHAYFVFGVNPKSNKAGVAEYLYQFFSDMEARSPVNKPMFDRWYSSTGKTTSPPINKLIIQDATYYTVLCWNYVDRQIVEGNIGKVGTVTKFVDGKYGTERVDISGVGRQFITIESPKNIVRLRKQITATHYQELTVSGLMFSNRIYGPNKDYISTLASKEGEEIIIPLNVDILTDMNKLEANTLMYDAMLMVFNAYEWKKLKWYQTGFFKIVTIVIAVAITVVTGGLGSFVSGLIGAAAAGVGALLIFAAQTILAGLVVSYAFKFAADKLGIEVAAILAVVAMCYGLASDSLGMPNLPFADELLNIGMQGIQGVTEFIGEAIEQISSAMGELTADYEESMDKLLEINKELQPTVQLDPIGLYTDVGMLPNESADSYLYRNLAFPELGLASLNAVSNYVDTSLNLDIY